MKFQNYPLKCENKHIFSHIGTDTFDVDCISECFVISIPEYSYAK